MASTLLGRTACPECGFAHAHVKISEKENAKPYRHCPECSAQYFPRNKAQADALLAKSRAERDAAPAADAIAPAAADLPTAPATVPPPVPESKGYRMVLGVKVPL